MYPIMDSFKIKLKIYTNMKAALSARLKLRITIGKSLNVKFLFNEIFQNIPVHLKLQFSECSS